MEKKVLVFDSGLGGLSVVDEITRMGLNVEIDYLADNAFFPYGEKSDLVLLERIPSLIKHAAKEIGAHAAIIACNTASTIALYRIRQICEIPIVGVVPAIKPACALSETKTIGVLATPRTIGTAYFDQLIEDFAKGCKIIRYGPPNLAKAAEEFLLNGTIDQEAIENAIAGLVSQDGGNEIDTIVLACTHYPFLKSQLESQLAKKINWVDSGNAIAKRLKEILSLDSCKETRRGNFILSSDFDHAHKEIARKFKFGGFLSLKTN